MKNVIVEEQCPNVAKILTGPIVKYITLATNNCGYSGKTEELRASYIHHFFSSKSSTSKEENHNWREATNGPFVHEYWKTMKTEISSLEPMGACGIFERYDNMNTIQPTWAFKCYHYSYG